MFKLIKFLLLSAGVLLIFGCGTSQAQTKSTPSFLEYKVKQKHCMVVLQSMKIQKTV